MSHELVLRVSAFSLVKDITPWQQSLAGLGMSRHGGEDPRCLGFGARGTYHILMDYDLFSTQYGKVAAEALLGQTIPYYWVADLDATMQTLPGEQIPHWPQFQTHDLREVLLQAGELFVMLAQTRHS